MNKRDAMVISKNEFKFTDEEAKVFNNNIEKAVDIMDRADESVRRLADTMADQFSKIYVGLAC